MYRVLLSVVAGIALLVAWPGPMFAAEETAASKEELKLRPGDTITWTPEAGSQHRLRFGGTVDFAKNPLPLTKFADVAKILTGFDPPAPAPNAQGEVIWPAAKKVTAKVKADADKSGVSGFDFTCGFNPHRNAMVTTTFTIEAPVTGQPARNIQIISAPDTNPLRWVLQTKPGDPTGNRSLRRRPAP